MRKFPDGHSLIPKGTPIHVTHLLIAMLKSTFATIGGPNYPLKYNPNINETGILIDTIFNKETMLSKHPQIIVSRGDAGWQPIAVGDMGGMGIHTGNTMHTSIVPTSASIKVIAAKYLEAEVIANEVYNMLVCCRMIFPQLINGLVVSGLSMGMIAQVPTNEPEFLCQIYMNYTLQYQWTRRTAQNLLNHIALDANGLPVFTVNTPTGTPTP